MSEFALLLVLLYLCNAFLLLLLCFCFAFAFAFAFALFFALLLHLLSARDSNQRAAGEMAGRNLELRCRQPTKKNLSTSGCNSREECLIV